MADTQDTYMPPAEPNIPALQAMPKVKPDLCRIGTRVLACSRGGTEIVGTVTHIRNFNAFIKPDKGGNPIKTNLRNLRKKLPPLGFAGYRGCIEVAVRRQGEKVTFMLGAQTLAADKNDATKRLMAGARWLFPASCERVVHHVEIDERVVE